MRKTNDQTKTIKQSELVFKADTFEAHWADCPVCKGAYIAAGFYFCPTCGTPIDRSENKKPLTPQQRREYIAEKILGWKKVDTLFLPDSSNLEFRRKAFRSPELGYFLAEELPDFENVDEWLGAIWRAVAPKIRGNRTDVVLCNISDNLAKGLVDFCLRQEGFPL